jgi:predicted GNAT family acetyltransferase
VLTTSALRVLTQDDRSELLALLDRDPVANVFVASRLHAAAGQPWRLAGDVWGHLVDGALDGACWSGANLVPAEATHEALQAFAERARRQGRRCSSVVGPRDQVLAMWSVLEPAWGPAREVRSDQPLMATSRPPAVTPDPEVRPVRPDQLDLVVPACVAMFTEEVGVSPNGHDGGAVYRARVAELVRGGRAFARFDGDQVVFKAEIGAVSPQVCQVQGVWVHPELRGRGLSVAGMAAVVELARATVAPTVSLYVNAWNTAARRAYERVGFEQVGTFATVLF